MNPPKADQGYRSGHRPRSLNTRVGKLQLDVPCERSGKFHTKLFNHYQRSEQAFILALQEMYLSASGGFPPVELKR